jgi:hypothetical protein
MLSGETDISTVAELSELVTAQLAGGDDAPDDRRVRAEFRRFRVGARAGARRQDLEGARRRPGAAASAARVARMLEITGADQMITVRGETEVTPEPEQAEETAS